MRKYNKNDYKYQIEKDENGIYTLIQFSRDSDSAREALTKEANLYNINGRKIVVAELGIFLTSNSPDDVRKDVEYYAKLGKTKVIKLRQPSSELGTICKKPFPISILSFQK